MTPPRKQLLVAVEAGIWHAVDARDAIHAGPWQRAICGGVALTWPPLTPSARLARGPHQVETATWSPLAYPVSIDPCPGCWWQAVADGVVPEAPLIDWMGPAAGGVCNALRDGRHLDAGETPDPLADDADTVQLLTRAAEHRPAGVWHEACTGGDCDHDPGTCPHDWRCRPCSVLTGGWHGEWEGRVRGECAIDAPCEVLTTIAAAAGVTRAELYQLIDTTPGLAPASA